MDYIILIVDPKLYFDSVVLSFSLISPSLPITYRQFFSSLQNNKQTNQISYFKSKTLNVSNSSISEEMLTEELRIF
jgi:hypothetical protein